MTDLTLTTGCPDHEPGLIVRLADALAASHAWAHAVRRRYNRTGPAGLHLEPARIDASDA